MISGSCFEISRVEGESWCGKHETRLPMNESLVKLGDRYREVCSTIFYTCLYLIFLYQKVKRCTVFMLAMLSPKEYFK